MRQYIESLEQLSRKQLILLLAREHRRATEPLAIVGMGCRLPGGIGGPDSLWRALARRRVVPDGTSRVPTDSTGRPRWNLAAPDIAPLADLLRRGAYLDDVDVFDADRFGVEPTEADWLDPQQRLLLTVADQAIGDAGLTLPVPGRVGVYVGLSGVDYHDAALRNGADTIEALSVHTGVGATGSAAAARIAVGLGTDGPVLTVDTACSSALTALHLAGAALRAQECDVALVGGCQLLLSPYSTAVFARAGVLSPTGRCRPFTAVADGYVRGEGCGVLALVRASDAAADGLRPYAFVRGSSVYQRGARASLALPSGQAQQQVMADALRAAQVDPAEVRFVEAQANGSRIADLLELDAVASAYRRSAASGPALHVGSVKANLGYLEVASGAVGLMKTALVLNHGRIPAEPDVGPLDPVAGWERTGLRVPRASVDLPVGSPRLAGTSAFGFTGTYAHALLEAPAEPRPDGADAPVTGRRHWLNRNTWC